MLALLHRVPHSRFFFCSGSDIFLARLRELRFIRCCFCLLRLPPRPHSSHMSFFQRVVHHLVNEVLVSGLANRCESKSPTGVFFFLPPPPEGIVRRPSQRSPLFSRDSGSGRPWRMRDRCRGPRFEERSVVRWRRRGRCRSSSLSKGEEKKKNSAGHSPRRKKKNLLLSKTKTPQTKKNSPTFQRFAVRSNAMAQELAKKST